MVKIVFSKLATLIVANLLMFPLQASTNVDEHLQMLDEIKSNDNHKFNKLLLAFEEKKTRLNQNQSLYLKYLKAYAASFNGELDLATKLSNELATQDINKNINFRANLLLLNILAVSKKLAGCNKVP